MTSLPTPSHADEPPYQVQIIPACTRYALLAGGEVCGYRELSDWRTIAAADAELVRRRRESSLVDAKLLALDQQVSALREALASGDRALATAEADRDRLHTALLAKDAELQDERVKPRIGSRTAWLVSGGLAITLAVVVAVSVTR